VLSVRLIIENDISEGEKHEGPINNNANGIARNAKRLREGPSITLI
jgi:hypothetical protein